MSTPFTRSLRSLRMDRFRLSLVGLVTSILLLAAWMVWFFLARISLYEISQDINYLNITSPTRVTANAARTRTNFEHYLGSRIWGFALITSEYAPLKGLNGDLLGGVGLKYDIVRNSLWKANIGYGMFHRNQWATSGATREDIVGSLRLLVKVHKDVTDFGFTVFYQPSFTDQNDGLMGDAFVLLNATAPVGIKIGYSYSYYANPFNRNAPGVDSSEYLRIVCKL